jgi:hypothetical protein
MLNVTNPHHYPLSGAYNAPKIVFGSMLKIAMISHLNVDHI